MFNFLLMFFSNFFVMVTSSYFGYPIISNFYFLFFGLYKGYLFRLKFDRTIEHFNLSILNKD